MYALVFIIFLFAGFLIKDDKIFKIGLWIISGLYAIASSISYINNSIEIKIKEKEKENINSREKQGL